MAYEALVQRHVRVNNIARADMSPGYAVWYGALAGYALWAV
jgi:solute carrier family 25 carnitine/acylcarnitine transporter 20/29